MSPSFTSAATVEEALTAIDGGARPIAGGTDLVVGARQGKAPLPDAIVAIDRIDGLTGIHHDGQALVLGTLVTHEALVADATVRQQLTALADASAIVGSHATRAQGTIGGNVMNASPAMDTGGPLLCLDAAVTLRSQAGERTVGLAELWTGPGQTTATANELLTALTVPIPTAGTGSCYVRLEYRRQMEIAVVGATAVVTVADGTVTDARIAITALAPTIRRVPEAEAALVGTDAGEAAITTAAAATAAGSSPISDVRGSAGYRSAMAEVMARRAISGAITRAGGGSVEIPASQATFGDLEPTG
ncbi:MAG TPA: FAD binding domain-containing protein [Actinomycetota bacterium]|nr:FAD binding domain-containing protein [Actinomycetota bacterium]